MRRPAATDTHIAAWEMRREPRQHVVLGTANMCDHEETIEDERSVVHTPVRYPVKVPTVNVEFKYPTRDGSGVTLSSGSADTAHEDFFNAWDPRRCSIL